MKRLLKKVLFLLLIVLIQNCSLAPEAEFSYSVVRGKKAPKDKKIVSDSGSSASVPKEAFDTDAQINVDTSSSEAITKVQELTKEKIFSSVKVTSKSSSGEELNNPKTEITVCLPPSDESDLSKIVVYESDNQIKQVNQVAASKISFDGKSICIATKVTNGDIFLAKPDNLKGTVSTDTSSVKNFKFFDAVSDNEKTDFKVNESTTVYLKALNDRGELIDGAEGLLTMTISGPMSIPVQNFTFAKEEKGKKQLEFVFTAAGNYEVRFDFYGSASVLTISVSGETTNGSTSGDNPPDPTPVIVTEQLSPDPSDLAASLIAYNRIALAWSSAGGSTKGFKVSYQIGNTAPSSCLVGTSQRASTESSFTATSLMAETTYSFRVCSINGNNPEDVSSGITLTATTSGYPVPAEPYGLSLSALNASQIQVNWNSGGGSTFGFQLAYQQGSIPPSDCNQGTIVPRSALSGTSYVITGLTRETVYAVRVCSVNGNQSPDLSAGITGTRTTLGDVAPPDPTNLQLTANSESQISLSWDSGGGTTSGYVITFASGSTPPANCQSGIQVPSSVIAGTNHSVLSLTFETQYSFRVCAVNSNQTPLVSAGITGSMTTLSQAAPPNPTGSSGSVVSASEVSLNWISGGGTTFNYRVSYQTGAVAPASCSVGTQLPAFGTLSGSITGLTHETQYSFRICSANNNSTPALSSGVTLSLTTSSLVLPPDPSGFTATPVAGGSSVSLSWAAAGGSASGYKIAYQAGATAPASCSLGSVIASSSITGTSYTLTGLTHETQYSFRVCSLNANAVQDISSGVVASATTTSQIAPSNPSNPVAFVDSTTQISLTWASGGGSAADYIIAYQSGATAPASCASGTVIPASSITGTNHSISDLTFETFYSFRICAINANATPDVSSGVTVSATTHSLADAPNPTSLSGNVDSDTQVTLSWSSGGGTTSGYRIAYQTGATAPATCNSGTQISAASISGTSKVITGLLHENQYSFRVCAINANATPNPSSGVTSSLTTLGQAAPPNPTGLNAVADSASQISLGWVSGGGSTANYRISYQTGGTAPGDCASGTVISEGAISGTSKTITGLTHETQYSFRICAINANNTPDASNGATVSVTTQSLAAPPNPTAPNATANSASQITLSWNGGGGTTSGYRIAYQAGTNPPSNCASGTVIPEGSISGTSKAISGLVHETQYSFRICAINSNATPSVSSGVTASATTQSQLAPQDPNTQSATADSASQITLSWSSGGGTTSGYRIAYQTGATAPANCASGTTISEGSIAGTSKAVTGLTHETQYSFRVCAINANATPSVSTGVTASATTQSLAVPNNPTGQSATADSASQITLSWSSGGGTTSGYRIAYQTGATAPANCASGTTIAEGSIAGTNKAITNLTHETQYSFRICAINANATPNVSTGVTATATTQSQAVPSDPVSPSATVDSTSQITLSWTSGGGTTAGYRIAYQTGSSAPLDCSLGTVISEGSISGTSKAITGLTHETQYSFRVCAINSNGTPSVSEGVTVSATTQSLAAPNDPTSPSASANSASQITLSWTSGGGTTSGYRIAYQTGATAPANCASGTTIAEGAISGTSKAITGLTHETQYSFRVCAINANAAPNVSAGVTASATTQSQASPPDVTAQSATPDSDSQITLSWTSGGGTTSGYRIAYQTGATAPADCASGTTISEGAITGTNKAITGLTFSTQYSFRICAINANATPNVSAGVTATATTNSQPPAPDPTSPSATANSSSQITLSWTSGGGTTAGYRISYQSGATAPSSCSAGTQIGEGSISGTSHAITALTHETQYSFRICSINSDAPVGVSSGVTVSATTQSLAAPNDPTSPSATANSASQITLSWTSGGGTTSGYRIAYQTGATAPVNCASGTTIAEGAISGTSKAITGLTHETQYSFRICAINANATPNVSSGVTATATTQSLAAPNDPTSPSATANSASQITLSWTSGGGTTSGYRIAYQTGATAPANCASGTTIAEGAISGTSKAITALTHETQYSFRVCAINANATPNVSTGVTATATTQSLVAPNDPTSLSATADSSSQITLSWSSGGGTTSGYRIAYQTGATAPANCASGTTIAEGAISGTSKAITGLPHETQYSFRVCAINANATPNVSSGVTASTTTQSLAAPNDPASPSATVDSSSQITLSWSSGGGTTSGYRIAYQTGATAPATCALGTTIAEGSISGTSKAVTGLSSNTQYSFRICSINANATPNVSAGVTTSATTLQALPPDPTGFGATADSTSQITLSWTTGGGSTSGYRIAYQTGATAPANCASGTTIAEGSISGTSKAVTALSTATQYSFRVCAINSNGTPDVSSGTTVSATTLQATPADPSGLGATANSTSQITLSWTSGGGSTSGYRIAYQTGATAPANCASGTTIAEGSISGTSKAVTSLSSATQYSFRVCAINSNPTPDVSSGVTASSTTLQVAPNDPTSPVATVNSSSQITLSWTSGGGTTSGYRIAYQTGATAPANCASGTTIAEGSISGTSKAVSGLSSSTQYSFRVCAINSNSAPDVSSGVTASSTTLQAAPPNPSGQSATADSSSQITLSWTSGGGTTADYRIAYQTGATAPANCGSGTTVSEASISGTSYAITGLSAATQYAFRVCAINSNPTPDVSSGVTATATTLQVAPNNPTSPVATAASTTQIDLSWTSGGGTTADYRMSYQSGVTAPTTCALGTTISEASISGTSHSVTGLTAGTQYSFRICAINSNSTPDVSSGVTITKYSNFAAPPNPGGQTATANSTSQITVSWTSGGGTTAGYRISYQSGATAPTTCALGTTISEGSISGTSHAVTGLSSGTQYSFRVCSINGNTSPNSPDVSSGVTTAATSALQAAPSNPTGLTVSTPAGGTSATLSWTSGGGTTADYRISYQSGSSAPATCAAGTTISEASISGTAHTITGLTTNTVYSFRVCAINSNPTPDVSSGITKTAYVTVGSFVQITSGAVNSYTTCGLTAAGEGYCWGFNGAGGRLGNNATANTSVPTMVNRDNLASDERFTQIDMGANIACAITNKGKAYCWGNNTYGGIGDNTTTARLIPTAVDVSNLATNESFSQISMGQDHACGLTQIGKIYCWGYNASGQLGDNSTTNHSIPTPVDLSSLGVADDGMFIELDTGSHHSCAISKVGSTYCWGSNGGGRLGDNTTTNRSSPTLVQQGSMAASERFKIISAGSNMTCGISNLGKVYCYGQNNIGQIGDNTSTARYIPTSVATTNVTSGESFVNISAGYAHSCATTNKGKTYCWGANDAGQIGDNTTTQRNLPVAIDTTNITSGESFVQVATGHSHVCGLTNSGKTICWGNNNNGQLGDNTVINKSIPIDIYNSIAGEPGTASDLAIRARRIYKFATSMRAESMCSLSPKGAIHCWGDNTTYGEIGDNTTTDRPLPTQVANTITSGESFLQLSSGTSYRCGVTNTGKMYCWGNNEYGKIGDGTTTARYTPTLVLTSSLTSGESFLQTGAGNNFTCGLTNSGKIYCWGYGANGRLGNNATTNSTALVQIYTGNLGTGESYVDLSVHSGSACGITSQRTAYCWGINSGNIGDNTTTNRLVPTAIDMSNLTSDERFVAISGNTGSAFFACGLTNIGKAYCWGNNTAGYLGDGTTTQRNKPTAVSTTNLSSGEAFVQISLGRTQTCGATNLGKIYCWGDNTYGQLGDGTTTQRQIPTLVSTTNLSSSETFVRVTAAQYFTCATTNIGKNYCWGSNTAGTLGDNSGADQYIPVAVDMTLVPN